MTVLVDTSVLIDVFRGDQAAAAVLQESRSDGEMYASAVTRLEVLAGMRADEETATRGLLEVCTWHPLDVADLAIAATPY